ncbi:MAG: hypothetical protein ACRDBH_01465 [Bosea sp. (in: a-proteobacteria)]
MMRELKIDPETEDFVRDGAGGLVYDDGAGTAVLHALKIRFGADWLLPEDGSQLEEISRSSGPATERIQLDVERALGVLESRGRISHIKVTATQTTATRVDVIVEYRDARTGRAIRFTASSKGG